METDLLLSLKQYLHPDNTSKMDLKYWLNRPSEQLQRYPVIFDSIRAVTAEKNPDVGVLEEAVQAMGEIFVFAHLKAFQTSMGKGPAGKFEWHNLVTDDVRMRIPKQEVKRQA